MHVEPSVLNIYKMGWKNIIFQEKNSIIPRIYMCVYMLYSKIK